MTTTLDRVSLEQAQKDKTVQAGVTCPACGRAQSRVLRVGVRENPDTPVFVCNGCQIQHLTSKWEDEATLRDYYRSEYRLTHDSVPGKTLTPEERHIFQAKTQATSARNFKEKVPEGGSVLEIGCSAGGFLTHLQGRHELYGLEWNPEDAAYVRTTGGVPCEEGLLDDAFPGKTFNAIVAISVMEHQPDPAAWLRSVKKRLVGGGYLYLEVPHANDPLSAVYLNRAYQDFFYREPHITYWLPHQLHWFLDSMGFEATVSPQQRYGLLNHLNWALNNAPMSDAESARLLLKLVSPQHPMGPLFNRMLAKLDKEYRIFLQGVWASDTISAACRRLEI